MANIDNIKKYKHIHMIGIGGISMSGIAEILKNWGFEVTGSDLYPSEVTDKLIEHHIPVTIGHDLDSLSKADAVVYTAAIKEDDIEMQKAKELNIPLIERATFLGELTKSYQDTIGISGTHGKTTTTSMISLCFLEGNLDPSIQVGAFLKQIDGNYRVGNSEHFIIEACEYVESFLKFRPKAEVILNIDNDHLDYFKTFDNIVNAFVKYVKLIPDDGLLVLNADDSNCIALGKQTTARKVTYGIKNSKANFTAKSIVFNDNGFASYDAYHNDTFYKHIILSVPGMHNVLNSLACIALCHEYGISKDHIAAGLKKFTGAHRRFEYVGSFHNVNVYDDYGHHPTEIQATALALKNKKYNKSWVVFQPHTYSRTKNLLNEFANALLSYDHVIVTDIYAARETNTYAISSKDLVDKLHSLGKSALYMPKFDEIVSYLKDHTLPGDIVLTLGAGTVTNIGPRLMKNK
ncbi:MAG: UDP-N-acetylmuramate--L-alanine ligase [Clostridia bacterium]